MCVCLDDDKTSYDMVEAFMSKKGLCSISGSEKWDIVSLFTQIIVFEKMGTDSAVAFVSLLE